jgi:hypothetical protein
MSLTCNFCNKKFSSISSLNKHKTTAKYCIKIQNRINENNSSNFTCDFCFKDLTAKTSLEKHLIICKYKKLKDEYEKQITDLKYENIKLQNTVEIYKQQITELQDKYEKICNKAIEKPTTNINNINNINKLELNNFITPQFINNKIESKFTDSYVCNKMKGVAKFVRDHIITLEDGRLLYACYDVSRKIFKYKDDNGNEIKDADARKLIKLIKPGLLNRSGELIKYFIDHCERLRYSIDKTDDDELIYDLKDELKNMEILRDKTMELGLELNIMDQTSLFSKELAIMTS